MWRAVAGRKVSRSRGRGVRESPAGPQVFEARSIGVGWDYVKRAEREFRDFPGARVQSVARG